VFRLAGSVRATMGIHEDDIDKIREGADLVGIISQYLALKKTGGQNWTGLCPFHNEKTPSFSVSADKGFYYCFGCQASGDVISFVQELEGLDFPGAMEWLAPKVGISLRYTEGDGDGRRRAYRKTLHDQIDRAVDFYHQRLLGAPDAGHARGYLRTRGYDRSVVEQFRIGWAPDDWDQLAKSLSLSARELENTGLGFVNKRQRQQDFFRARVLFPIFDANGAAVGFGGRQMPGGRPPKYKNTSETEVYKKSRLLYGLNWAKRDVVASGEIIVCEGYTDVIGFFLAGLPRAVATCGTALTEDHVKLMKRFASRVVLAFDADGAGRAAADKFYEWEKRYEIEVHVADLPDGEDPGDLAGSSEGRARLNEAVSDAVPFLRYRIERALGSESLATPEGRTRAAEKALALVAEHPNELYRDQYLMEVASRTRMDPDRLRPMLVRRGASGSPRSGRHDSLPDHVYERGPAAGGNDDVGDRGFDGSADGFYGLDGLDESSPRARPGHLVMNLRESQLVRMLIHKPEDLVERLSASLFAAEGTRRAYEVVSSGPDWIHRLDEEPEQVANLLRRLAVDEVDEESDALEELGWVVADAARRVRRDIEADAQVDMEHYRELQPLVQWIALRAEELVDSRTRVGAIDALLAWLNEHQSTEGGPNGGDARAP